MIEPRFRNYKHGMTKTREYRSWHTMKTRCYHKECPSYQDYGGRGITVCDRWLGSDGFQNFLMDMGRRPLRTTLDRIDNNAGYEPSNCRWATRKEQQNNTRRNVLITYNGKTLNMTQWAEKLGVSRATLEKRKRLGWSDKRIITESINQTMSLASNKRRKIKEVA